MSLTKVSYSMISGSPANILDFGADSTGVADIATAITAALAASDSVYIPPGNFRLNTQINVPANKQIYGAGSTSILKYYGAAATFALYCGDSLVALNYGISISNLRIQLNTASTGAIYLYGTQGASVMNVLVDSATLNNANKGFVIDGGNQSSFFNILQNCNANHCADIGYDILSTGTSFATQNIFIDCAAFGDLSSGATSSIGMNFTGPSGTNSVIIGGNMENYGIGINLTNMTGLTFNGLRFEDCTIDINGNNQNSQCNFISCQDVDDITGFDVQNGFGRNTFFGCSGIAGIINKQEATSIIYSKGVTQVPVTITGYPAQTAALQRWTDSSGTVLAAIEGGALRVNNSAQTVGANEISIGSATSATVGAAGAASALPANPVGYLIINVAGTNRKIPFYTV